jgi:hypothetical protein
MRYSRVTDFAGGIRIDDINLADESAEVGADIQAAGITPPPTTSKWLKIVGKHPVKLLTFIVAAIVLADVANLVISKFVSSPQSVVIASCWCTITTSLAGVATATATSSTASSDSTQTTIRRAYNHNHHRTMSNQRFEFDRDTMVQYRQIGLSWTAIAQLPDVDTTTETLSQWRIREEFEDPGLPFDPVALDALVLEYLDGHPERGERLTVSYIRTVEGNRVSREQVKESIARVGPRKG